MTIISDGTGTGKQVKVDLTNRMLTRSIISDESTHHTYIGSGYNLNTGEITLTSANESSVLYFKNNEIFDYAIKSIVVGFGPSVGNDNTRIPKITVLRNPTAGTVISDASAVSINGNRNFGSNTTLSAYVYKGAEGKTLTGGSDHIIFYQTVSGRLVGSIDEILPKGTSIGIKITPPAGNTSMVCYAALIGYLETEADS